MKAKDRLTKEVGKILHILSKTTRRIGCAMLALTLSVSGLPVSVFTGSADRVEAAEGTKVTNAYVLETTTGINDGADIEFIEIKYKGSDNVSRRKLIFPNEDSRHLGYLQVANYGTDKKILDAISDDYGYEPARTWSATGDGASLAQYSTDQFYFVTDTPITSVDKIDAFMGDGGTWTCQGLRLFHVDEVYGLRMAGVWSNDWYIDFTGDMIAEVTGGSANWNETDANYLHMHQKARLVTDFSSSSYARHETQENHTYGFKFDFADRYMAGFECLANEYADKKAALNKMGLAEVLTLNVTYTDVYGQIRFLHLPAVTGSAYWTSANGVSGAVAGLGQQGGTLLYPGTIPDCEKITDVTCTLGAAEAVKAANIKEKGTNAVRTRRANASSSDDIRLLGTTVYRMNQTEFQPYTEGALLKYNVVGGKPILYHKAASTEGETCLAGTTSNMNLKEYDGKDLEVLDNRKYYLVQITTSDIEAAGTKSDLNVVLKYVDFAGRAKTSSEISLREATKDYYGYWPASVDDFAYKFGVMSGNTVSFLVVLNDVDHFTGLTINLEEKSKDDYQFKNLKIYSLKRISERKAVWRDMSEGGISSYLEFYRDFEGEASAIKILDVKEETLIQEDDVIPVDFDTSSEGEIEDTVWDSAKSSVTYADVMQNYGFTKSRKTYEVNVNVFDDTVATDSNGNVVSTGGNGDAGSENLFYFQLVFQNGYSAYVLANQQLEGDRFRSGESAYFNISTNQDYGEVTAIRVIPDDSSEDSKKYDKLRIDSIKVTEIASAGTHKCWVSENVGWIDIGYTEEQEKFGGLGRKGRSATEIARTFPISYTTYVAQLEFAIHTNEGAQKDEDENGAPIDTAGQFKGKIQADINYINLKGEMDHTGSFDLVNAMYGYMNKKPSSIVGGASSDPTIMFREKHTDRFMVNVDDAKQLVSMDLSITQEGDPYTWNIGSVSVSIVTEKGRLRLNTYGEYEYQRSKEGATYLCSQSSESTPAYQPWLKKGGTTPLNITFTQNEIKVNEEYGVAVSALTREPASQNDELNLFVFPSVGMGGNDISEYDLNATMYYAHLNGSMYETGSSHIKKYIPTDGSRPVFYAMGLRASCMTDLNRLILEADADRANMAYMDYAIVQQVRSGVVVANYYIDLNNENAFQHMEKFPSTNVTTIGYKDEQVLTMQFGAGTQAKNLVAEKQDIAVALEYKTAADPSGLKFTTPYIYLTDQQVNKIKAGQVVDIAFSQMFVGEVTGVKVASVGNIESYVDAVSVATYRTDVAGDKERVGFYSFGKGIAVSVSPVTMQQTADSFDSLDAVRSVTLTFKTSGASDAYESGTTDPVWMRLYYAVDELGNVDWTDKNDIREYLTDGNDNFLTGQTQSVRFLVTGAASLRRIELEPKSVGGIGNAGWSLESVSAQLDDGQLVTRIVGERIYEGTPRSITLSNITLAAQVYNFNSSRDAYDTQRIQMSGAKLIVLPEKEFRIDPYVYGSEKGCRVYAVEITTEGHVGVELKDYMKESGGIYKFTPPRLPQTKYYRIIVESVEVPSAKMEIEITINGVTEGTTDGDD